MTHCINQVFLSLMIDFVLAKSVEVLGEMLHYAAFNLGLHCLPKYSATCVKLPLSKRQKIAFHDQLLLNAGQKYCRMLQREHSAILSTFIKLSFSIKTFVLSISKRLLKTGFTVHSKESLVYKWLRLKKYINTELSLLEY